MLQRYENEPYLLAWEICNEPEWMFENSSEHGGMTYEDVQRFHAMFAAAIHKNSNKPVTTGSAAPKWNSQIFYREGTHEGNMFSDSALTSCINDPEAYLDFYQYHWYPWQTQWLGSPFTHTTQYYQVDDKPVIVGESEGNDVSDQYFNQTVTEMYENAYLNGFDGVCAWKTPQNDGHGTFENIAVATNAFYNNHPNLVYPPLDTVNIEGVTFVEDSVTIEVNDEYRLRINILPTNATDKYVSWSANNNNISINNGTITGIAEGMSTVTVTTNDGGFTARCIITITPDLPDPIYALNISQVGLGTVDVVPDSDSIVEGTRVVLTASAAFGYAFESWSGDITGNSYTLSFTMDSDKSIVANFVEKSGKCANPVEIESFPFAIDGVGDFCYVTSSKPSYVNSWNAELIEINGIEFTNTYADEMPPRVEGKYYIRYISSVAYAHFEIPEASDDPVNTPPTVSLNTGITLGQDSSKIISTGNLSATDVETDDEDLVFNIVQSPNYGTLEHIDIQGVSVSSFTQQDLTDGSIQYIHDGSPIDNDSFSFSVTDGENNLTAQIFEITINLNNLIAPEIVSPHADQQLNANSACQVILADYTGDIELAGSSTGIVFKQIPVAGTEISGANNEILLIATLNSELADTVSFIINVVDNSDPVITSVHNDVILDGDINGEAVLPDYTQTVTASDNCDNELTITQSPVAGTTISGIDNEITLTATDDAGNGISTTFRAIVKLPGLPIITSEHYNQEISSDENCRAELPDYVAQVTIEGGNAGITITQNPVAGTLLSGTTNEVTLTATSSLGLSTSISFNVAVIDETAPVITSAHTNQELDGGVSGEIQLPDYRSLVIASDNCDDALDISQNPEAETVISGNSNIVTLTVSDDEGNTAVATFNVSVSKTVIAPVITSGHPDMELISNVECSATLPDYTGSVTIEGGNSGITVTQTPDAGSVVAGSTNNVTLTATNSAGLSSSVIFNITVVDETAPVIVSTYSNVILDGNSVGEAIIPDYAGDVQAADNCDDNLSIVQNPVAGTSVSGPDNTVTLTVTDDSGNQTSTSFLVSVSIPSAPVIISVHNNKTLISDNNCVAILEDYTTEIVLENDETGITFAQTPAPGTIISGDSNIVVLTVTNSYNLTASASFNVTVKDETAPVITSTLTVGDLLGNPEGEALLPDFTHLVTATDNCDDTVTITQLPEAGTVLSGKNNILTITASDGSGNESAEVYTISVTATTTVESNIASNVAIYPNPSNGIINIEGEGIITIEVYSVSGKITEVMNVNNDKASIDLGHNAKGMYIMKVYSVNGVSSSIIMLE